MTNGILRSGYGTTTGSITASRLSHKFLSDLWLEKRADINLLFFFQVNAEKTAVQKEANDLIGLNNVSRVDYLLKNMVIQNRVLKFNGNKH